MSVTVKDSETKQRKPPLWWRAVRGTVRGTGNVGVAAYLEARYTFGVAKTRTKTRIARWKRERNFTADDMPEFDEVPRKRRRLFRAQYLCFACNRKYRSARGLNKHFEGVHGPETSRRPASPSKILGGKVAGKVRVKPKTSRTSARQGTTTTRSGNPMNSTIALTLKAAWGRMTEARPTKLSEIRDDMIGLEQVLGGAAGEAANAYRVHLIRQVGFNPITVQKLARAAALLEEAGREFSGVIAAIDEYYAADIAAAKKRKGGMVPSDKTLTS